MTVRKTDIELDEDDRIETGAVQFNDDWPGLFIRGDEALYLAGLIRGKFNRAVDRNSFTWMRLKYLANIIMEDVAINHDNPD